MSVDVERGKAPSRAVSCYSPPMAEAQKTILATPRVEPLTVKQLAAAIEDGRALRDVANELVADGQMSHLTAAELVQDGITEWKRQNGRRYLTDVGIALFCVACSVAVLVFLITSAQSVANERGQNVSVRFTLGVLPLSYAFYCLRRARQRFKRQQALSEYWATVMMRAAVSR